MTSNLELMALAKRLGIPNFYVIMSDEFYFVEDTELPLSIIVNLQDSAQSGSHWVLCFADRSQKIFYCSFGSPIPPAAKEFLLGLDDRALTTSDFQLQQFNDDTCGQYCLLILYLLNKGEKFEDIILGLVNDQIPDFRTEEPVTC